MLEGLVIGAVRFGECGHAGVSEDALGLGAVVAGEDAVEGLGEVAELDEELTPMVFLKRRGVQRGEEVGVGFDRDHGREIED